MSRARRSVDAARLSNLVARPGIDPRVWLTFATVTELGYDADEGIFADVTYLPTGEQETAFVAASYAGDGFGFWGPLEVGDVVVVSVPNGDPNTGPVIIARLWRAADKPAPDFKAAQQQDGADVPTADVVLRVKAGQKLVIRTSGGDGQVDIQAEGSAPVKLRSGGVVELQDASQPFVRGADYADALGTFLSALGVVMTAIGTFATAVGSAVPALSTPAGTLNTAIGTFANAISAFSNARNQYLSTRVKGQ